LDVRISRVPLKDITPGIHKDFNGEFRVGGGRLVGIIDSVEVKDYCQVKRRDLVDHLVEVLNIVLARNEFIRKRKPDGIQPHACF
jgi:hypothetical protein